MIEFIRNIIPRSFAVIYLGLDYSSKVFLALSVITHKKFKTKFGKKLIEVDRIMAKVKKSMPEGSQETKVKNRTIIPMEPNSKLASIIKDSDESKD